jgi:aryl-alcohol dehydrogenase-like predicted oxidoreductase
MRTTPLGDTGVQVNVFCLGAMYFGSRNDKPTSYKMLDMYTEAGGAFIDTANAYARWVPGCQGGESETLIGEWLHERGNRSQMFIATKVGAPAPVDGIDVGLRAEQIQTACEGSLRRLGIETIDLYYAHRDDRETPIEERLEAFDRLVRSGKVRFIGSSNARAWRLEQARAIAEARGLPRYCCAQQRYTYLRPRPGHDWPTHPFANLDLFDYLAHRPLTLLAWSPLLGSAYTRTDRPIPQEYVGPDSDARLAALREVAQETGATANQIVLAWMLHSTPIVIPLIAASTGEQMRELLSSLDVTLSAEQMQRLNDAGA